MLSDGTTGSGAQIQEIPLKNRAFSYLFYCEVAEQFAKRGYIATLRDSPNPTQDVLTALTGLALSRWVWTRRCPEVHSNLNYSVLRLP